NRLQVTAAGPWKNPRLGVTLDSSVQYLEFDTRLQGRAEGDLNKFAVSDLVLEGEGLRVSGSGEVNVERQALQFQLDVAARGLQPAEQFGLPVDEGTQVDLDAVVSVN